MTDITTIVQDAPTYKELADIAGELAARVQELEAALAATVKRWEGDHMTYVATRPFTPENATYYRQRDCPEVKAARIVLGEGRP